MNRTKIEWVKPGYTWNPATGCKHNCPYCYARRIAMRFDKHFDPTFHPERLDEPKKVKKPNKIFVCSMADLFGDWVPAEWIERVIETVKNCPQHTFMFLTKNPVRYIDLAIPENAWLGTSAENASNLHVRQDQMCFSVPTCTFLSIEPLQEDVAAYIDFDVWDWVIVGAETGPGAKPIDPEWVQSIIDERDIHQQLTGRGVPLFLKDNLKWPDKMQEYPEAKDEMS